MSFFKEFKEDFDDAVGELIPDAELGTLVSDDEDVMVNTFDSLGDSSDENLGGLFASVAKEAEDGEVASDTEGAEDSAASEEVTAAEDVAEEAAEEASKETVSEEVAAAEDSVVDNKENTMSDEFNSTNDDAQTVVTGAADQEGSHFYNEPVKFESKDPIDMEAIFGETENDDEMAVITKGMTITGDLESLGSVEVRGVINGNVKTNGKMVISGKIRGNSTAKELFADSAHINGEILSEGSVKIGNGSVVVGNIN
ncbi:MAG: polymer-forming cytoskeletal protein, partial [Eubacterium sp.]|nr:polymer-forming cytoskeletal protein [Eubacterium sp.]